MTFHGSCRGSFGVALLALILGFRVKLGFRVRINSTSEVRLIRRPSVRDWMLRLLSNFGFITLIRILGLLSQKNPKRSRV